MTTEKEKAKRYDEALEWMREVYPTLTGAAKEDAEHYFPELKESEDETHRKWILEYLYDGLRKSDEQFKGQFKSAIAWLEKQKENPKSADFIPSDCVSDAKCENLHNEEGDFVFELRQIISSHRYSDIYGEYINDEEAMASEILELCKCELEKQKEQKPITINKDEKEFLADEITAFLCNYDKEFDGEDPVPSEVAEHFYLLGKQAQEQKPTEWSEEDEKMLLSIIKAFRIGALSTIGQEQWLKLLPERFNLQPSLEHLQKEKVYDIIAKLTNLSYSNLIPFNSEEYKKINEITSDVFDLLKYPIEKRQEQKPVEWSEEDKQNYKVICSIIHGTYVIETQEMQDKLLSWLKSLKPQSKQEQKESSDKSEISDGYHTFNELYYYRLLYNAAFFNLLPKEWVHKSKRHHDGKECFGGGWFIVMANLPTGQIANHYEIKDWDLFHIPEKETADKWDRHTPQEAAERLHKFLLEMPEQKPEAKLTGWVARDKEFDSYYGTGLILYSKKPRRSDNCWNGDIVIQLPWQIFPDLKWVDSPMEVEIIIRKK